MEAAVGWLRAYIMPSVVAFGLLGNAITIGIFLVESSGGKWSRFTAYGIAIGISDSLALIFNTLLDDFFGRGLLYASDGVFMIKLDTYSSFMCKVMEYVPNVVYFSSSYLLIMFTFDRTLMIFRPLHYMSHLYLKTTLLLILTTVAVGLIVMSPMALIHNVQVRGRDFSNASETRSISTLSRKCKLVTHRGDFYKIMARTMLYFMTFGSFVLPSIIVCCLSFVIVAKLSLIRRKRASILPSAADNQMEMTRFYAHLGLAVTYCVLVTPLAISICMRQLFETKPKQYRVQYPEYAALLAHISRFTSSVKDVNYALNFWVYLVFVKSFRQRCQLLLSQLLVLLRCTTCCSSFNFCQQAADRVHQLKAKNDRSVRGALLQHRHRLVSKQYPSLVFGSAAAAAEAAVKNDGALRNADNSEKVTAEVTLTGYSASNGRGLDYV